MKANRKVNTMPHDTMTSTDTTQGPSINVSLQFWILQSLLVSKTGSCSTEIAQGRMEILAAKLRDFGRGSHRRGSLNLKDKTVNTFLLK